MIAPWKGIEEQAGGDEEGDEGGDEGGDESRPYGMVALLVNA
jgi:hypothetical protein